MIDFELFKKQYLDRFVKYYIECTNNKQRKVVMNSIYNNKNLSEEQKNKFWDLVVIESKRRKNVKVR